MHIELHERRIPDAVKAVDLASLDDEYVAGASLELLSVDGPQAASLPHELDFIVRMSMGPGSTPGEGAQEEHRDVDISVIGADKLVRAALEWQILLMDTVHARVPQAS